VRLPSLPRCCRCLRCCNLALRRRRHRPPHLLSHRLPHRPPHQQSHRQPRPPHRPPHRHPHRHPHRPPLPPLRHATAWSSRPIRWPPKRASRYCAPAARPPMRRSQYRRCWDSSSRKARDTAPAGATVDMFLGDDRQPLAHFTGVLSGRSTGVPGAIAALGLLQHEHGKLHWRELFGQAERLAAQGFIVSPRLASFIVSRAPQASARDAVAYFSKPDGTRLVAGDVLKNPAFAATVHRLAIEGPSALYHGTIAQDIVRRVHEEPIPGSLTLEDLARYRPIESEALCRPWRTLRVCTPPPPAGGVDLLQGLLLLAHTDIDR